MLSRILFWRVRKLSTLLEISKKYHYLFSPGAYETGMCCAATCAYEKGEITSQELELAQAECTKLVQEIRPSSAYLRTALFYKEIPNPEAHVVLIYEAWIDKLKSQNK